MTHASISTSDLRTLLEQGRPVRIIDIRRADEREWTIPGSIAVDAYDVVNAGHLGSLGDVAFDSRPSVMVCGRGQTARRAKASSISDWVSSRCASATSAMLPRPAS